MSVYRHYVTEESNFCDRKVPDVRLLRLITFERGREGGPEIYPESLAGAHGPNHDSSLSYHSLCVLLVNFTKPTFESKESQYRRRETILSAHVGEFLLSYRCSPTQECHAGCGLHVVPSYGFDLAATLISKGQTSLPDFHFF
jgi:hypothetical protein